MTEKPIVFGDYCRDSSKKNEDFFNFAAPKSDLMDEFSRDSAEKIKFSLHSLLENLENRKSLRIFAARKEDIPPAEMKE